MGEIPRGDCLNEICQHGIDRCVFEQTSRMPSCLGHGKPRNNEARIQEGLSQLVGEREIERGNEKPDENRTQIKASPTSTATSRRARSSP